MRKFSPIFLTAAIPFLLSTASFAQAPPGGMPTDLTAKHQDHCTDLYARESGRLAFLAAKLNLTDQQRPVFAKWQQAKLETSARERDACLKVSPKPGQPPTLLERDSMDESMMSIKIQGLQSNRPALQALYETLTPAQKSILDRPGKKGGHQHDSHKMKHPMMGSDTTTGAAMSGR